MQLSSQSIRRLCLTDRPMITPFVGSRQIVNGFSYGLSSASYDVRIDHDLVLRPGEFALANTIEDLDIPLNVVAYPFDKSTYARFGVIAFNTLIDPGFRGNLTLELANLGRETVVMSGGDPICQLTFHWLDEETELPYAGKYQNQARGPQPAITNTSDYSALALPSGESGV